MPTLKSRLEVGESRRGGQQSDLWAKQTAAASPWPLSSHQTTATGRGAAPTAGSAPENGLQRPARANSVQRGREEAGAAASTPPHPAGGDVGAPVLPPERRPRPPAPLLGGAPSSREAWCREASWAGDPRAAPALHEERPGSTSLASERAGASPAIRAEALGPGEAAHLAVAGARLVHEGAVLTGPHGGRGGM